MERSKRRRQRSALVAIAMIAARMMAADGEGVDALVTRARCRSLAGETEAAAAAYREVLAREPAHEEAMAFLARLEREGKGERLQMRQELLTEVSDAWRQAPVVAEAAAVEPRTAAAVAEMNRRLDAIVLPEVNFAGASLSGALATLGKLAVERESATGGHGVNLVLLDPANTNPPVTLAVRELSLRRVLDFVTEATGSCYEVQADAVVVRPGGERAALETAVLPLSRNERLSPAARDLAKQLRRNWNVEFDDAQAIGRRYRRQDEIGTPYCVTVDFDTLDDHAVTIRDRDTMTQERVALDQVQGYLAQRLVGC